MWSTPDLSDITLILTGLLAQAVGSSSLPFVSKIKVSACSPETMRDSGEQCFLNLYLLHIGRDPYWRNTPLTGPRPQLNNVQPLSLNLSYLLTAYCDKDTVLEQRALSIALAAIQSNPIMSADTVPSLPDWSMVPNGEFVLSIEADTIEEMSRLWQAFTVPIRLSALIRASVIFIEAPETILPPEPPPSTVNLSVMQAGQLPAPLVSPPGTPPALGDGFSQFTPPLLPDASLNLLPPDIGPLVMVGGIPAPEPGTIAPTYGAYVTIAGSGLDLADAAEVFLFIPGSATLWDITTWRQGTAASRLTIAAPESYAAPVSPLAHTPLPGIYSLAVGSGGAVKSNSISIAIAPRIDGVANPPTLDPASSGTFTVTGAGFLPATDVTLVLGATALNYSTAAIPPAGDFIVNSAGTSISFLPPVTLTAGSYPLLLAVNGIPAPIGWLAVVA